MRMIASITISSKLLSVRKGAIYSISEVRVKSLSVPFPEVFDVNPPEVGF